MRFSTKDDVSGATVSGDLPIEEIAAKNAVLIPFAINHLGIIGPMARRFLFGEAPPMDYTFPATRLNVVRKGTTAMEPPCPIGVVQSASCRWKSGKEQRFYGTGIRTHP